MKHVRNIKREISTDFIDNRCVVTYYVCVVMYLFKLRDYYWPIVVDCNDLVQRKFQIAIIPTFTADGNTLGSQKDP